MDYGEELFYLKFFGEFYSSNSTQMFSEHYRLNISNNDFYGCNLAAYFSLESHFWETIGVLRDFYSKVRPRSTPHKSKTITIIRIDQEIVIFTSFYV